MSYDLTVYAAGTLTAGELTSIVESIPGLSVGDSGDNEVTVLRGKNRSYAFTVFGPYPIEYEDVPDDAVPYVLNAALSWRVVIEGSDPAAVTSARRFSKALALAADGAAVDEQTEEILGGRRGVEKMPRGGEDMIRLVNLDWYSPASAPSAPQIWLELARKILPEALPRRFGNHQPYRQRLDRDGDDCFVSQYSASAWFTATSPCLDGGLYRESWGGLLFDNLRLVASPLDDPRWRDAVRRFFVEYARRRGSVLATGEVLRNHKLNGVPDRGRDQSGTLRAADGLLGLPAQPIWLTWLGNGYLPLVRDYLPAEHTTHYDEGALYAPTDEPADRGQLATLPDPIPLSFRVTAVPSAYGPANPPDNSPAAIRPSFGGS